MFFSDILAKTNNFGNYCLPPWMSKLFPLKITANDIGGKNGNRRFAAEVAKFLLTHIK